MNGISQQVLRNCKRRIQNRLANPILDPQPQPMFTAGSIHYEVAERTRGLNCGGIGAIHQMVRNVGLIEALDQNVKLFKVHLP
ncbi:MAG TPA: IS1380 family transposase, partial [Tepidisphaeraceae bacterium]|nr:IS1380 family transposase [Tepidisphaeraceae bacterium]